MADQFPQAACEFHAQMKKIPCTYKGRFIILGRIIPIT